MENKQTRLTREHALKNAIPPAVAALTDLLNVWMEVSVDEKTGESDPAKAARIIEKLKSEMEDKMYFMYQLGAVSRDDTPGLIAFVRQCLEDTFNTPDGTL